MSISRTNFDNLQAAIERSKTKQQRDINEQVRSNLEAYRAKFERRNFLEKRIASIEESLEVKYQQIESLQTTFNNALFHGDDKSAEDAKATRVELAAEIESLENEVVGLRQELEDVAFDDVKASREMLDDFKTARTLLSGHPETRCLDNDLENALSSTRRDHDDARRRSVGISV